MYAPLTGADALDVALNAPPPPNRPLTCADALDVALEPARDTPYPRYLREPGPG